MFESESYRLIKNIERNNKLIYEYLRYEHMNKGNYTSVINTLKESNIKLIKQLNELDSYSETQD